jgi:hypothetical protein
VTQSAPVDTSEAEAKSFIYQHESGNVPCKINGGSINCAGHPYLACGLGQALPCSKLQAVCPDLADYGCQDNWFSRVYLARYHYSWVEAKAFWVAHRWW